MNIIKHYQRYYKDLNQDEVAMCLKLGRKKIKQVFEHYQIEKMYKRARTERDGYGDRLKRSAAIDKIMLEFPHLERNTIRRYVSWPVEERFNADT